MHIEAVNLAGGDYELVPLDTLAATDINLNCTNLAQDLGQAPEEPQASSAQEGKPWCIIPLFSALFRSNYLLYVVIILFTFLGVARNHRCMSLGTYVYYPNLFLD